MAEYCERSPQFPDCTFVFKEIRGYQESIDGPMEYIKFFEEADKSLPSDQSKIADRWEASITDKELLGALKHVMQGKCSDVVNQLSAHGGGFELLREVRPSHAQSLPDAYGIDAWPRQ